MSIQNDQNPPFETLTKLEAAERQLRVAIRLFFERKDLVAVQTLASVAQGLLTDLAKTKGIKGIISNIKDVIRPEHVPQWSPKTGQ